MFKAIAARLVTILKSPVEGEALDDLHAGHSREDLRRDAELGGAASSASCTARSIDSVEVCSVITALSEGTTIKTPSMLYSRESASPYNRFVAGQSTRLP